MTAKQEFTVPRMDPLAVLLHKVHMEGKGLKRWEDMAAAARELIASEGPKEAAPVPAAKPRPGQPLVPCLVCLSMVQSASMEGHLDWHRTLSNKPPKKEEA